MFLNIIYLLQLTHENHQHSNFLLTTNESYSLEHGHPLGAPFLRTTPILSSNVTYICIINICQHELMFFNRPTPICIQSISFSSNRVLKFSPLINIHKGTSKQVGHGTEYLAQNQLRGDNINNGKQTRVTCVAANYG